MTKKDYVLIAKAIKDAQEFYPHGDSRSYSIACYLSDALETDNPAFDRSRFLEACGV
jgi:hypothetical protein